jgi:sortase B
MPDFDDSPFFDEVDAGASRSRKPGRGKRRGPWFVVFVIALVVLIGSLVALGVIAFSYFQGQQKYEQIASTSSIDVNDIEKNQLEELSIDWDALRAINSDVVAWIYMPGTVINYPVVQGTDNDYYLYHDFESAQGWIAQYGTIFLDYANKPDFSDACNFIYGHHMNDGSMFSDLAGLSDPARFNECRTVYLLTPAGNYRLRSFSLVHCAANDPIVQVEFGSYEEWVAYLNDKVSRSEVSVDNLPDVGSMTRVFALATCDNYANNGRWVLYCYVDASSVPGQTSFNDKSAFGNVVDESAASAIGDAASAAQGS